MSDVLDHLAGGMSEDDIRACLAFAAERERRLMFAPDP